VDTKAKCGQLNLAQVAETKKYKKETKTNKCSAHLVRYRLRSVKAVQ